MRVICRRATNPHSVIAAFDPCISSTPMSSRRAHPRALPCPSWPPGWTPTRLNYSSPPSPSPRLRTASPRPSVRGQPAKPVTLPLGWRPCCTSTRPASCPSTLPPPASLAVYQTAPEARVMRPASPTSSSPPPPNATG